MSEVTEEPADEASKQDTNGKARSSSSQRNIQATTPTAASRWPSNSRKPTKTTSNTTASTWKRCRAAVLSPPSTRCALSSTKRSTTDPATTSNSPPTTTTTSSPSGSTTHSRRAATAPAAPRVSTGWAARSRCRASATSAGPLVCTDGADQNFRTTLQSMAFIAKVIPLLFAFYR